MSTNDLPLDPPMPPAPPEPRPEPRNRSHRITCEGCECVLTGDGEIISLGAKFKANRKLGDRIDELTDELTVVKRERDTARAEVAELSKPKTREPFLK